MHIRSEVMLPLFWKYRILELWAYSSGDPGEADEVVCMPKGALAVVSHVEAAVPGTAMSLPHALAGLAALGQPTRLAIFRLLMQREPAGLLAGAIAQAVGCPANTLSSHIRSGARRTCPRCTRRSLDYLSGRRGRHACLDARSSSPIAAMVTRSFANSMDSRAASVVARHGPPPRNGRGDPNGCIC